MSWLKENWFKLLATGILLGALGTHPYAYYQLLRWIVCAAAAYAAYLYLQSNRTGLFWLFAAMVVLFNPVAPIYMSRGTWPTYDLIAALIFAASLFLSRGETSSYNPSPLRIVLASAPRSILELLAIFTKKFHRDSTVLTFSDLGEAWVELSRTDPDLLVVKLKPDGWKLLQRLAEKQVKYPIVVMRTVGPAEIFESVRHLGLNIIPLTLNENFLDPFRRVLEAVKKTQKEGTGYQEGFNATEPEEDLRFNLDENGKKRLDAAIAASTAEIKAQLAALEKVEPIGAGLPFPEFSTPKAQFNPEILYLFECKAGHRIYRRDQSNRSGCSRCGGPFSLLAAIQREEGESPEAHHVRTLAWRKPRVN